MKNRTYVLVVLLVASLAAGIATAAPQLDTLALGNGIAFGTDFAFDKAFIRVTGPNGFVYEGRAASSDDLAFAFDRGLSDGDYKWQLLMVEPVSAEVLDAMRDARRLGEKALARQFNVVSHTFTGDFRVEAGALLTPSPASSLDDRDIATKDQQFLDDVIIDGSLCVGFDCVNGESFGFDTIRMKENNIRMHFQDTSSSASFPTNDWRLIINDSSNGGANHFSIEDSNAARNPFRVEAGAPANALVVEADGDIGIGTLNPVVDLHVVTGNTPTLRLEQDGSNGFTPQTWDLAGNEANLFIRDATNGSQLPFRIQPGADSNTLFLASDNNVGIQTDSPKTPLHVRAGGASTTPSNSAVIGFFQNTANATDGAILGIQSGNNANAQFWFGDTDDDNAGRLIYRHAQDVMSMWTVGAERLRVDSVGDVCIGCDDALVGADFLVGDINGTNSRINAGDAAWTNSSSRSLKENIKPVVGADILSKINSVDVFTYDFIDGPKDKLGLIAEDFHTVFERGPDTSINGQEVQMALWLAVQELTAQNAELAKRLEGLEATNAVE